MALRSFAYVVHRRHRLPCPVCSGPLAYGQIAVYAGIGPATGRHLRLHVLCWLGLARRDVLREIY